MLGHEIILIRKNQIIIIDIIIITETKPLASDTKSAYKLIKLVNTEIIILSVQMRKMRLREFKPLAQGTMINEG